MLANRLTDRVNDAGNRRDQENKQKQPKYSDNCDFQKLTHEISFLSHTSRMAAIIRLSGRQPNADRPSYRLSAYPVKIHIHYNMNRYDCQYIP